MTKVLTKSSLDTIELDLASTDITTVEGIINRSRNDLLGSLNMTNNFFVDQSNKANIDGILQKINTKERELNARVNNLTNEETTLITDDTRLNGREVYLTGIVTRSKEENRELSDVVAKRSTIASRLIALRDERRRVTDMITNINTGTTGRKTEYQNISNTTNRFDYTRSLQDMKGTTYDVGVDLMVPGGTAPTGYALYDEHGNNLRQPFLINLTLEDGTTQEVQISDIVFNPPRSGNLDISRMIFRNRAGTVIPAPTQGYQFTLNPGAYINIPGTPTIKVIHSKPLNVLRPNPNVLTSTTRQTELNRYNSVGNIVEDAMDANWFNHHEQLEKEAVFAGLKHSDGPKFDKLTTEQKEDLYRKIQANMRPLFARRASWAGRLLHHIDNYATFDPNNENFHAWITSDNHAFSKDPEINKNAANWRNNLHNTLEDQITAYYKHRFNRAYTDDADGNTFIKTQLTEYLTEQLENKQDNNTHQDVEADVHAINFRSRRRFGVFGRNDNNYMRFFSGMSSVDIGEQHVNIITDKGQEGVKYTMKIDVSGKNQISTTVKIGDKKERTYKAGNPMALMESILRNPDIPQGKTRMHIAYNVAKGMIQKAQEDDISLRYRNAAGHNMVIRMDGKNIVLDDEDDLTNHGGTNRRITETLFDYSLFEGTNSWENRNTLGRTVTPAPDNRNLRMGIDRITRHFNCAMGQLNDTYNQSTQRRFLGIMRSNTSSDFPTSPWTSPIKKLLNCKTNTNFDFSTSVSHNGKSVQIERQKNTFILRIGDIELKGKDLGKLLNKRKGGIRLFDGIERDICGEIYKNMVEKLRTNNKIARSNFGVMDPMTGRMYIVDEDGQIGYIRAEDARTERRNLRRVIGANTLATGAIAGGLTAAGIATGGAAALAAGLSWGAAGTAASRTGAGAAGVNIAKDIDRRIIGVGYGMLDHPPVGRIICDEVETREIYKNPLLMGKLMKAMNIRLGQI